MIRLLIRRGALIAVGRRKRVVSARRWPLPWLLGVAASVVMLGAAGPASASYPGRAGAIVFPDRSGIFSPAAGGNIDTYDLYAVRPPSRHLRHVLGCNLYDGAGKIGRFCPVGAPPFSPDGRQLVFAEQLELAAKQLEGTLVIANADGSLAHRLAPQTAHDEQPAFLPGGQTLVFAGRPKQGARFDLYMETSSGTGLTRLTSSGAEQPAPCANGSIAFVHRGDVYLLSRDHRTQRRLTLRGGKSPDCSPDGHWIAFVRHRDLYLISSSGKRVRRLTTHHALHRPLFGPGFVPPNAINGPVEAPPSSLDLRPAFAPTGQRIAIITFICRSHGNCCGVVGSYDSKPNCVEPVYELDVVDLRGRVASKVTVGSCAATGEGSNTCDVLGGVAWQPLSRRP